MLYPILASVSLITLFFLQINVQSYLINLLLGHPDNVALVSLMLLQGVAGFNSFAWLFMKAWTPAEKLSAWREKIRSVYVALLGEKVGGYIFGYRSALIDMSNASLAMDLFLGGAALVVALLIHLGALVVGAYLTPSVVTLAALITLSSLVSAPLNALARLIPWQLTTALEGRN